MPADGKAGGTWIALREDGISAVLLNGAFVNHERQPSYRHSRGLIIPNIMQQPNPAAAFEDFRLDNLEPFTLIMAGWVMMEWRWDGEYLHRRKLHREETYCWSSATLYNDGQQMLREKWFTEALAKGDITGADSLMRWQSTGGYGAKNTDIVLQRDDNIATVSTTVVSVHKNKLAMAYLDYLGSHGPEVVQLAGECKSLHEEKRMVQEAD